ncbi:MAG TPA: TolC family protein, partial [Acidobacteriota bacterium]|nr:TolC family protein [Acidobacteriota bacterium]
MTRILFYRVIPIIVVFLSANLLVGQDKDLSLNEAISIALQNNPELLAAQLEVDARQARIAQAGARPNPELIIVTEDISGSGRFEGFDSSQTTAQLSQRFELGGKRAARRDAASLNRDVAEADLELKRREIAAKVRKSFFAVLLSQEQVRVMQDLSEVSKRFSGVVIERIQAGKIPPIDEVKAQAIVALAEIELTRSTRALESARYELAAVLG